MQPPPFSMPEKKKNTGLIVLAIVLGVGICCVGPIVAVGGLGWFGFRNVQGTVTCAASLSAIRDSTLAYAKANGDKLPKADTWQDDVRPFYAKFLKSETQNMGPFHLFEPEADWVCENADGTKTGIAFNKDLSGVKISDIKDRLNTVLVFEAEKPGKNLNESYKKKPKSTSPKIFNEPRGWITMPVEGGDIDMKGKSGIEVKTKE